MSHMSPGFFGDWQSQTEQQSGVDRNRRVSGANWRDFALVHAIWPREWSTLLCLISSMFENAFLHLLDIDSRIG